MFKEIVDDARRTPDFGRSQKLTMSTLCSVELKNTAGKGEIARHEQFLNFPVFSTHLKNFLAFFIKF